MAVYTSILQAGTSNFCSLQYSNDPSKTDNRNTKMFLRLPILSPLFGVTPVSARLYAYVSMSEAVGLNVPMYSTSGTWDGSSTYTALDALTLGPLLDTQSKTAVGTWMDWDVLGSTTTGVLGACLASSSSVTFVATYAGNAPTQRIEILNVGRYSLTDPATGDRAVFDSPNGAGTNLPYLVVTTDAGGIVRYPVPGCAIGGMMY